MLENSFIHRFKTPKNYYIYDVNTNLIININKELYNILDSTKSLNDLNPNSSEYKSIIKLKERGLLSSNRVSIIEHPDSDTLEDILNRKLSSITLQITQQCNLRCKYCVYSGSYNTRTHSNKIMSFETAKKSIDFLINNSLDSNRLNISFYGGEPLLRYDFIKQCIKYTEDQVDGKEISFQITTNATLLTLEMINFFKEHNVYLTISLDGDKNTHNKNRVFSSNGCGSFDKIIENLEIIKESSPDYFSKILFNVVLDPQNNFNCANEFFTNYETVKNSNINATIINDNYSNKKLLSDEDFFINSEYEVFKMFLSKLGEIDKINSSKLIEQKFYTLKNFVYDRPIFYQLRNKAHHNGPCIPGAQKLFINVNGDFYPCEKISEESQIMKIGNINHGFYLDKIYPLLNIGKITENECRNCWAFNFCNLCAAFADGLNELSAKLKFKKCLITRQATEKMLKNYCMFKEFEYNFEEDLV